MPDGSEMISSTTVAPFFSTTTTTTGISWSPLDEMSTSAPSEKGSILLKAISESFPSTVDPGSEDVRSTYIGGMSEDEWELLLAIFIVLAFALIVVSSSQSRLWVMQRFMARRRNLSFPSGRFGSLRRLVHWMMCLPERGADESSCTEYNVSAEEVSPVPVSLEDMRERFRMYADVPNLQVSFEIN